MASINSHGEDGGGVRGVERGGGEGSRREEIYRRCDGGKEEATDAARAVVCTIEGEFPCHEEGKDRTDTRRLYLFKFPIK